MAEAKNKNIIERPNKINPLAILSYLWVLCLIPLLIVKDDEFVRFHAKQGFVLFIFEIITVAFGIFPIIGWAVAYIGSLVWLVLSVIGIINVLNGEKKDLPLIGDYAKRIKV